MSGLQCLLNHASQVGLHGVQVHGVLQPGSERGHHLVGVIAGPVEPLVHRPFCGRREARMKPVTGMAISPRPRRHRSQLVIVAGTRCRSTYARIKPPTISGVIPPRRTRPGLCRPRRPVKARSRHFSLLWMVTPPMRGVPIHDNSEPGFSRPICPYTGSSLVRDEEGAVPAACPIGRRARCVPDRRRTCG